jgi:chlorophyll synthase
MAAARPNWGVLAMAALYSAGAHGIMTLNDFKSVAGDRRTGVLSLPVLLSPEVAAKVACVAMAVPQCVVVALLAAWGYSYHAAAVAVLLLVQVLLMPRLLRDPCGQAPWYNATGTSLYVIGMLVSAFALASVP